VKTVEELLEEYGSRIDGKYEVRELILKVASNRYLVRSALQKSIRRGYVQRAMDYASYLYHYDPKKVWRDLAIIAIEDIGVGDPDAVFLTHWMDKSMKHWMGTEDALRTLMCAVVGLATAPQKSRACCELSLGSDLLSGRMSAQAEYDLMPKDAELKFNADPRFEAIPAINNLYVELMKARGRGGYRVNTEALPVLVDAYREVLSPELHRMGAMALDRAHDNMFCAALPVATAYTRSKVTQLPNDFVEERFIKGVPAMAFDMHTHPGKVAIRAFINHFANQDLRISLLPKDYSGKAFGSLIFTEEGGLCNNQIDFCNLKAFQDQFFHWGFGVPMNAEDAWVHLVRENIHVLHDKREWASKL